MIKPRQKKEKRFMGGVIQWTVEFNTSPFDDLFSTDDHYVVRLRIEGQPPNTAVTIPETRAHSHIDCLQKFAAILGTLLDGAWRLRQS